MVPCRRQTLACLPGQLHRLVVHARHRVPRITRPLAGLRHFLPIRCKLGVILRWNHPRLQLATGEPVFLSVLLAVWWLIEPVVPSSVTRRAGSRSAINCASCSPLRSLGTGEMPAHSAAVHPRRFVCGTGGHPRPAGRSSPARLHPYGRGPRRVAPAALELVDRGIANPALVPRQANSVLLVHPLPLGLDHSKKDMICPKR